MRPAAGLDERALQLERLVVGDDAKATDLQGRVITVIVQARRTRIHYLPRPAPHRRFRGPSSRRP